jgi:predicted transcriptional regulator
MPTICTSRASHPTCHVVSLLIPQWYHGDMAMTLRLSDEESELLRACAEREGTSMQEVARLAIAQYVSDRRGRLEAAILTVATNDAELLDRLSK